jgi:hypothetical protein
MHTLDEKVAFAARLRAALKPKLKQSVSPAKLALQFNLRHPNEPITSQAAHKWLSGKALPTPDKAETLARWLGVSCHWLRFGSVDGAGQPAPTIAATDAPNVEECRLLAAYRTLNDRQRLLIVGLIEEMAPPVPDAP